MLERASGHEWGMVMKRLLIGLLAILLLGALAACGSGSTDSGDNNRNAENTEAADSSFNSDSGENAGSGQHFDPLDKSKIAVIGAGVLYQTTSNYMIKDEGAIAELVDWYNGLTFVPLDAGEEDPGRSVTWYALFYYERSNMDLIGDPVAEISISPDGYVRFNDGTDLFDTTYRLTSSFDEAWFTELLTEYGTSLN